MSSKLSAKKSGGKTNGGVVQLIKPQQKINWWAGIVLLIVLASGVYFVCTLLYKLFTLIF